MARSRKTIVGAVITVAVSLMLIMSAVMKLKPGPEVAQAFAHLGLPDSLRVTLAILELSVAVIYLIPATSVTGAILLAGYMGGAICTHWRVGDPVIVPILFPIVGWLGLYLREPRLKALLPLRTDPENGGSDAG